MAKHEENAIEVHTKAAITRAWTDLEPKFLAWVTAGGLLSLTTIVLHYFGVLDIPFWIPIVVTYLGGAIVSYLKHTTVRIPSTADTAAAATTAGITGDEVVPGVGEVSDGENIFPADENATA